MKTILKKVIVIFPALIAEAVIILLLLTLLRPWAAVFEGIFRLLGFIFVLFVISYRQEGTYKILWLLFFMALPIPAAVAYLLWGDKRTVRPIAERIEKEKAELGISADDSGIMEKAGEEDERILQSLKYVEEMSGAPAAMAESAKYYPIGEECWTAMLEEMRGAKEYIYLEYFIVQDGVMWQSMLEIMELKAADGVDVRLMYDDLGCIATFSLDDIRRCEKAGVKCLAFNPLKFISGTLNNRSHRKMLIVDGKTAFSGGINLADEYINAKEVFGHWKDVGFKVTGPAVGNFLYMYATFWNAFSKDKVPASVFESVPEETEGRGGAVLSYYDSPANRDGASNNFYIEMLGNAKSRAWFYTPYLMLGDTLLDAFVRAAKRGVDVRIITPGIPDKKLVFRMTRSFCGPLMEAGVKIYEYTPGFVHAKASLYDDKVCTVGTVNLDYRSLYLHFENNSIFWDSPVFGELERDFRETFGKCHEVRSEDLKQGIVGAVFDGVLRIFSPLC